jgi:UDP-N-acetylmuramoylalanine--D-glutamate ligase
MSAVARPSVWTFADRYRGQRLLVVGLGLSGVSALRYLAAEGADVTVTDSRAAPGGIEALRAEFAEVPFALGAFAAPQPLATYDAAVVSPGVDLRDPFITALQAAGVPILGDVELFARAVQAPHPARRTPLVVGITGSNGKSTVTTLVGEMVRAAGRVTAVGGNLGTPALDLLADDVAVYVLELSSFQLETIHSLRCTAAAFLNLSDDHLDRHGSMARYGAIKAGIWTGAGTAVVNRDDAEVLGHAEGCAAPVSGFTLGQPTQAGDWGRDAAGDQLVCRQPDGSLKALMPVAALPIAGQHNLANALAAAALAEAVGVPDAAKRTALQAFTGLPHRCRLVREIDGVRYYNDSKGTNVGATLAAIQGLPPPIHWLAGGQAKGQDFSPLSDALQAARGRAYLFGQDSPVIAAALAAEVPVSHHDTLQAALTAAHAAARAPASVLLSPACASFDQFRNYIERGEQFERAVAALS